MINDEYEKGCHMKVKRLLTFGLVCFFGLTELFFPTESLCGQT